MTYTEDTIAYPVMVKLAACLVEEMNRRALPAPCHATLVYGPLAIVDSCQGCSDSRSNCGGSAWVRLVTAFPSTDFPNPSASMNNCANMLAYQLEVGVTRCLPTGINNNIRGYVAPGIEEQIEATRLQMADMAAMRAAILCCLGGEDGDMPYVLGAYNPMSAAADCGGGIWTVTIGEY